MTVPVILATAGVIALLVGILGGIKAKEIEISALSNSSRITASIVGVLLIILAIVMPFPGALDNISPDSSPSTSDVFFTLEDAKPENFYTLENASFVLKSDGKLAITGSWAQGVYINQSLPVNFRLNVQFSASHPNDGLIIGLSDGARMRPNYHFVMDSGRTAFKRQLGFDVTDDTWDKEIKTTYDSKHLLKPNTTNEIILERRNGKINITLNNSPLFELGVQDIHDIGNFNYLYLTGGVEQQILIDSLVIEKISE